jgi:dTMP kinase
VFITLEGPDGSGKSMQVPALTEFIHSLGYEVLSTREPGGTYIGDQIREIIMRMDNKSMHPRTEILLFCAARAQIVSEVILPQLEKDVIVISDRYADSTLAYQGYGHGVDLEVLRQLLNFATGGLTPDLTILFDVDIETGLRRRQAGGGELNLLDDYELAFHRRVRMGYLELAAAEPHRWVRIDATQTPQQVQLDLQKIISERLTPRQ